MKNFTNNIALLLLLTVLTGCQAAEFENIIFTSKASYHAMEKPCACQSDIAANGICGRRAALCRRGGYHISDCGGSVIQSISEYKKVQNELCKTDY